MKVEVELSASRLQYLSRTVIIEVPDGTSLEDIWALTSSELDPLMIEEDGWDETEYDQLDFEGIASVEEIDDEDDDPDLRLVRTKKKGLVPAFQE